jgi:hypothetical protein
MQSLIDYKIQKYKSKLNEYIKLKKMQGGVIIPGCCAKDCGRMINPAAKI